MGLVYSPAVQAAEPAPRDVTTRPVPGPAPVRGRGGLLEALRRAVGPAMRDRLPNMIQVRPASRPAGRPVPVTVVPQFGGGGVLADSTEADNWMRRATEGVEAKDWKLACDALQRLIDTGGDVVISTDKRVYVSARRRAHERIAGLPDAGRRAYRLLYDPQAKTLYERALRDHDESALLQIVSRYLLTAYGDDASDLLASWYLDAARAGEAVGVLSDALEIYPDSDVPVWIVRGKLALAFALLEDAAAAERALAAMTPDDLPTGSDAARFAELRDLVRRIAPRRAHAERAGWPMLLGDSARTGRMPHTTAAVLETVPYLKTLPTHADLAQLRNLAKETFRLPVYHVVTDGEQLLVRTDARLIALDTVSLDLLWQSPELSGQRDATARITGIQIGAPVQLAGGASVSISRADKRPAGLFDDVGGTIAIAHGLAFVVDRLADPRTAARGAVVRQPGGVVVRAGRNLQVGGTAHDMTANPLLAFDLTASTDSLDPRRGEIADRGPRWTRGDSGNPNDELAGVVFLAAPIEVGAYLLVPYARNTDLYAGVLRPADGSLVRQVFLCSAGAEPLDPRAALHPAVADQVAYVPTGQGLLAALNTSDYSIRWASRYPRVEAPPRSRGRSGRSGIVTETWLSGAPVVVGRRIVLAPTDSDRLVAFDRHTGEVVWSAPRGAHRYVVGVTQEVAESGERVRELLLVGGERLSAIDAADGKTVWSVALGRATGRGALVAGADGTHDQVFMPTDQWVAVVDAVTGNVLRRVDPPAPDEASVPSEAGDAWAVQAGLGNLLSWGGSVISADIGAVRVFLERGRAYELARAAHARDPGDVLAAIRLASLELQRDDPIAAVNLLDAIDESGPRDARRRLWLARIRVRALIACAQRPDIPVADAVANLERAFAVALTPEDRLAGGLALASLRAASGDRVGAVRQYADMCFSPLGGMLLRPPTSDGGGGSTGRRRAGWLCRGATLLAVRSSALREAITADERDEITRELNVRVDEALAAGDFNRVRLLADAGLMPAVSQRVYLALARRALNERVPQYEEAEFFLTRAAWKHREGAGDPGLAAEAIARLARLYAVSLDLPATAVAHLDELAVAYGDQTLPADLGAAATGQGSGARVRVPDFVSSLRARIPAGTLRARAAAMTKPRAFPTAGLAGIVERRNAWPIRFAGRQPESAANSALFLIDDREASQVVPSERPPAIIVCDDVEDLGHKWSAFLNLEQDFLAGQRTQDEVSWLLNRRRRMGRRGGDSQTPPPAYAVADGQTMIVASTRGVHAVGLASGLRLWARALSGAEAYRPGTDGPVALADRDGFGAGKLALVLSPSVLELVSARTGVTIWRREISGGTLGAVEIVSNRVVAMDQDGTQAWLFALADGRFVGSVEFTSVASAKPKRRGRQPARRTIRPVVFDTVICGPFDRGVIAYSLRTGEEAWRRRATDSPIAGLFKPAPDILGVGSFAGELTLIQPGENKVVLDAVFVPALQGPIYDGVIHQGLVVVQGRVLGEKNPVAKLVGVSAKDGTYQWEHTLPDSRLLDASQLRVAGNAIPLLETVRSARKADLQVVESAARVTLIDKSTGQPIGRGSQMPVGENIGLEGAINVWRDRIVVGGRDGAVLFRTAAGS